MFFCSFHYYWVVYISRNVFKCANKNKMLISHRIIIPQNCQLNIIGLFSRSHKYIRKHISLDCANFFLIHVYIHICAERSVRICVCICVCIVWTPQKCGNMTLLGQQVLPLDHPKSRRVSSITLTSLHLVLYSHTLHFPCKTIQPSAINISKEVLYVQETFERIHFNISQFKNSGPFNIGTCPCHSFSHKPLCCFW